MEEYTLSEEISLTVLLDSPDFEFPIVVKTCGNTELNSDSSEDEIVPADKVMLLEKKTEVEYALIKVMDLESEKKAITAQGPEFVDEYRGFVDEEILLPLKYPGKVKLIHPPGKSRRYSVISQINEDLPRYVRFETDTVSAPPPGHTAGRVVKKGTVVEVTGVVHTHSKGHVYLECTAEHAQKHIFRHDTLVNCTAIPDESTYTLPEVLTSVLLPKVVKFENEVPINDVADFSSTNVNNTIVMTYGPMQALGSEKRRFMVAWLGDRTPDIYRPGDRHCYNILLIPSSRWDTEMVKVCNFSISFGKKLFMEREFPSCQDPRSAEEKLYLMTKNESLVTWLKSDVIMSEEQKIQPDRDDSDCMDGGYWIPGPPIPPRKPLAKAEPEEPEQTKVQQDILAKVAEKMKLGFGQVHRQLSILFSAKNKPKPTVKKRTTSKPVERDTQKPVERQKSVNRPLPKVPSMKTPTVDEEEGDDDQLYEPLIKEAKIPSNRSIIARNQKPRETVKDRYAKLKVTDAQIITRENQTIEDFCKYSVNQVSECFRLCAMDDFAKQCIEHKVDGAFLAGYDLQDLQEEPFNLSAFKLRKVKVIIHDGWRPEVQN